MHALHHRDLRPALIVTALAAALAIVVTLVFATSLTDLHPGSSSAGARATAARQSHLTRASTPNLLAAERLTHPLGARIRLPWGSAEQSAPVVR